MIKYEPNEHKSVAEIPYFIRGTTPQFEYTLTDYSGEPLDLSQFPVIKVTLAQNGDHYSDNRITLEHGIAVTGNVISFALTEEQSQKFDAGEISMQIYGKNAEDNSWATLAEDVTIRVRKSLKDGDVVE